MSAEKDADESVVTSAVDIKENLHSGMYRLIDKRGRSKVWEFFSKVQNENGEEVVEVVACKMCFTVFKFAGSTSNLVKHKCYIVNSSKFSNASQIDVNSETKQEGIAVITEWVVKNCRSFKIIDDSGLKKFASFLIKVGATFGANVDVDKLLPHPTTISRNISVIYESHFGPIKAEIEKYKCFGYSITSDIWTDNYLKSSYLSCTVHYIKEGVLVDRLMAMKSMKETSCTALHIRAKIREILEDFGCDLEVDNPIIVTDRGSNMIKAFRDMEKIHCINHLLNNAVEKAINAVSEMAEIVSTCSKLVKYFKKSGTNSSLGLSLKSFCPTRWNTVYYLLKSIETNWIEITNILKDKSQTSRIEGINLNHLSSIVRLLEVFENVSKKLEASKRPTIHLIIPNINKLKKTCLSDCNESKIIESFKSALQSQILLTVLPNLTKYHNIALFLFPPTNKLVQFSPAERDTIIKDCKEIMCSFLIDNNIDATERPSADDEFAEYIEVHQIDNNKDQVEQEIRGYSNINAIYTTDFDCLTWWNVHKNFFPLLHKTSCKIFCIPASSAASERTFSDARNLITEKRCLIATNPDNINKIMFLHSNIN